MVRKDSAFPLELLALCSLIAAVASLTLPYQVTNKPRHTKYSSSTTAPPSGSLVTPSGVAVTPANNQGISTYRVKDSKGTTCILVKTDAILEVDFRAHGEDEKGETYIPNDATVEGDCSDEDEATMRISWKGYILVWKFSKTPGGERWYVDDMELTVSTELPHYHTIRARGNVLKLYHDKMVLPTPVGRSYDCEETVIHFEPHAEDNPPEGLHGTLYLRAFQIQPFMYKGADFGPTYDCNTVKSIQDETVPVAVGSTLAIAVLLTVTGYGVFRYFKIKKVQYNTME